MTAIREIVSVEIVAAYRLQLRFDDGVEGEVDVEQLVPFRGVFAAIKDPDVFAQVQVEPELGTIVWPNGADLGPLGPLFPRHREGSPTHGQRPLGGRRIAPLLGVMPSTGHKPVVRGEQASDVRFGASGQRVFDFCVFRPAQQSLDPCGQASLSATLQPLRGNGRELPQVTQVALDRIPRQPVIDRQVRVDQDVAEAGPGLKARA